MDARNIPLLAHGGLYKPEARGLHEAQARGFYTAAAAFTSPASGRQ
jgi:hypothetical protein